MPSVSEAQMCRAIQVTFSFPVNNKMHASTCFNHVHGLMYKEMH